MGKREVVGFAAWQPFSLFLRFSQESLNGRDKAPFCQEPSDNPQFCTREERHLPELGLLACTWQRLAIVHDEMMMVEGRGVLGKTKNVLSAGPPSRVLICAGITESTGPSERGQTEEP